MLNKLLLDGFQVELFQLKARFTIWQFSDQKDIFKNDHIAKLN